MTLPYQILGSIPVECNGILTTEAIQFIATLHRLFNPRRVELLQKRVERQLAINQGKLPDFLPQTAYIRNDPNWRGAPPAPGLIDRRVEITGPVDRKMVINALNSKASTFMADFEDSNAPTWENCLHGQRNLLDANKRTITFVNPNNNKRYALRANDPVKNPLPTLIVRPRGWHMVEKHLLVNGEPISASIFDFGLYFFHNAKVTLQNGFGPYFYLPKMESHLEARLWNDIFNVAQDMLRIPRGTIRATVLIETILAAFEMDEIIYELRSHSSGLNCGRWDYIFSFIKKFKELPHFVLPDRSDISMTTPFMDAYVQLLIKTCHKRGVHAMGGMAAQIPIKGDQKANEEAMNKVRRDKLREVQAGHDGTWVAHPDLVLIAKDIFDKYMPQPNQMFILNEHVKVTGQDLIQVQGVKGKITERGLALNVDVAMAYMESWLRGLGCVPIHNLMEDAATAEISRSQLYQWIKHQVKTEDGKSVTKEWVSKLIRDQVLDSEKKYGKEGRKFKEAGAYLEKSVCGGVFDDFLTTLCYDSIISIQGLNSKL